MHQETFNQGHKLSLSFCPSVTPHYTDPVNFEKKNIGELLWSWEGTWGSQNSPSSAINPLVVVCLNDSRVVNRNKSLKKKELVGHYFYPRLYIRRILGSLLTSLLRNS